MSGDGLSGVVVFCLGVVVFLIGSFGAIARFAIRRRLVPYFLFGLAAEI
jgi:hypothetical protein